MIRRLSQLLCLCLAMGAPVQAEEVVAGISQNQIAITANFDGSEILIFGAVKREEPIPSDGPLDVIIAVSGPSDPVMVRRKEKRFGIWINTDFVQVDSAPSFYAIATTAPLQDILSSTEDLRYHISTENMIRLVGAPNSISDAENFSQALIRIRQNSGLYQTLESQVSISEDTLFRTSIALPANLTEGNYSTRIFLTRNKSVVDAFETVIDVRKVGLERWLYSLAHNQPMLYGFMSLAIAIAAGWGASAIFRYVRN